MKYLLNIKYLNSLFEMEISDVIKMVEKLTLKPGEVEIYRQDDSQPEGIVKYLKIDIDQLYDYLGEGNG